MTRNALQGTSLVLFWGGIALVLLGIIFFVVAGAAIYHPTPLGQDNTIIGFLFVGMLISLPVGALLLNIGLGMSATKGFDAETKRIVALGKRVSGTVEHILIEESTNGKSVTRTGYHLQVTWINPETEQVHILKSQSLARAVANSYHAGDPVVIYIDPSQPEKCRFDVIS